MSWTAYKADGKNQLPKQTPLHLNWTAIEYTSGKFSCLQDELQTQPPFQTDVVCAHIQLQVLKYLYFCTNTWTQNLIVNQVLVNSEISIQTGKQADNFL